jgi:aldose 1-epimerase
MNVAKHLWGCYDEHDIYIFKLRNDNMEVRVSNFGAVITSIITPDKDGNINNIVLGYDTLDEYITDGFYTGCLVGRFAGRIADAGFSINGVNYPLAQNEGESIHLHGGIKGFGKQAFKLINETVTETSASIQLFYRSLHLEEGYPGNLDVWVTYSLSADNHLTISYKAISDKDTHVNLTNHSYFNLRGRDQDIFDHQLMIEADECLVIDKNHVPTGDIVPVKDTPYSFKPIRKIAAGIRELGGTGYNECYVLNNDPGGPNATLHDDKTGRTMTVETDMPALLFYTGDYLSGKFKKNNGVCLETQFFPNAPNHLSFPNTLLKAGEQWNSFTRLGFYWKG